MLQELLEGETAYIAILLALGEALQGVELTGRWGTGPEADQMRSFAAARDAMYHKHSAMLQELQPIKDWLAMQKTEQKGVHYCQLMLPAGLMKLLSDQMELLFKTIEDVYPSYLNHIPMCKTFTKNKANMTVMEKATKKHCHQSFNAALIKPLQRTVGYKELFKRALSVMAKERDILQTGAGSLGHTKEEVEREIADIDAAISQFSILGVHLDAALAVVNAAHADHRASHDGSGKGASGNAFATQHPGLTVTQSCRDSDFAGLSSVADVKGGKGAGKHADDHGKGGQEAKRAVVQAAVAASKGGRGLRETVCGVEHISSV